MIMIPDDIFRDCAVSMKQISDSILMVARLFHEGRLLGATMEDYNLAIELLQRAVAAQVAQNVMFQACLDEDKPERVQ